VGGAVKLWAKAIRRTTCTGAPSIKPDKQPRDVFAYFIHEGKVAPPQAKPRHSRNVFDPYSDNPREITA